MKIHELLDIQPARTWNDAYPIGNGTLGAMVFGDIRRERLQMNEDSVWSGGPMDRVNPDAKRYGGQVRQLVEQGRIGEAERLAELGMLPAEPDMRHYEPLGDVFIDFDGAAEQPVDGETAYRRTLDLDTGLGAVAFDHGGIAEPHDAAAAGHTRQTREYFASYPDSVVVYHIESGTPLDCVISVSRLDRANHGISRCEGIGAVGAARGERNTIGLWGVNGGAGDIGYAMAVRAIAEGGSVNSIGGRLRITGASAVTILVTGRTTYRNTSPMNWCITTLDAAEQLGYSALRDRHVGDFTAIMNTMSLDLGGSAASAAAAGLQSADAERRTTAQRLQSIRDGHTDIGLLETYLTYARYLLASSSRPGSLPANLQGIWNDIYESPWGSKYTVNINAEMNYWFAEKAGLGDLHLPLLDHIRTIAARGRYVAGAMYGARGFVCHHNTDIWGDCAPQDHYTPASLWPMGGAWLALHILEHWEYTRDEDFLARNLDVVRDAVQFVLDTMIHDRDGHWVTGVSVSPENTYVMPGGATGSLCIGATMDMQIARELFTRYVRAAKETGREDDTSAEAERRLPDIRPDGVDSHGRIREWPYEYGESEPGHRHFSPCFGLYPGTLIRVDATLQQAIAVGNLVDWRMRNGSGPTGWSKAWAICLQARLREAENAWNSITRMLTDSTLDNLLDNHPPFQIDGNFGALAGFLELLVQDYEDTVFLLPALPAALPNGCVAGIRLKSGAAIDLTWRNGELVDMTISALRDGQATFALPDGRSTRLTWKAGMVIACDGALNHR